MTPYSTSTRYSTTIASTAPFIRVASILLRTTSSFIMASEECYCLPVLLAKLLTLTINGIYSSVAVVAITCSLHTIHMCILAATTTFYLFIVRLAIMIFNGVLPRINKNNSTIINKFLFCCVPHIIMKISNTDTCCRDTMTSCGARNTKAGIPRREHLG